MNKTDLRKIDLNLLVTMDALLQEGSVTRAAARMGRSQPALSRALARLRETFDDPLMVESGRSLVLTPRAEELREQLTPLLAQISEIVEKPGFDPTTADQEFRISAPEGTFYVVVSGLLADLYAKAPGIRFTLRSNPTDQLIALTEDRIDLAIDTFVDAPAGLQRQSLLVSKLVCVMRPGHPATSQPFDLGAFLAWPHVLVESATGLALDTRLSREGISRHCPISVGSFFVGSSIIVETDHIMVLPEMVASVVCGRDELVARPLPLDMPRLSLDQLWHARQQHDPSHIWLRNAVFDAAQRAVKATSVAPH